MYDYYQLTHHPANGEPILSNSGLKMLYDQVTGKKVNLAKRKQNFSFGGAFHTALLEGEKFNNEQLLNSQDRLMLYAMLEAVYAELGLEFFEIAQTEREHFARMLGYYWKGKVDWQHQPAPTHQLPIARTSEPIPYYHVGRLITDFKSTGAHSQQAFERDALTFGYDLQSFVYLNLGKAESMTLIGVQKTRKQPKLYYLSGIDREHDFYRSGKQKAMEYLQAIKPLLHVNAA